MTRVVGTLSFSYGFHPIYFYTRLIVPRLVAPSSLKQSISRKPPVQCQSNSGIQRHDSSARASLSSRLMIGAARRTARGGYRKVFTDFPKPPRRAKRLRRRRREGRGRATNGATKHVSSFEMQKNRVCRYPTSKKDGRGYKTDPIIAELAMSVLYTCVDSYC